MRTNTLFVVFDDLNDSVARMGGHPQAKTPNLDRLMQRGVRFTNAQCNAPICAPSRASFLTGIYPHNSGYYGYNRGPEGHWMNNSVLGKATTLMEHYRNHGYTVCGTGKLFHHGHEKDSIWDDFGQATDFGPFPWDGREETRTWGYNELPHPSLPQTFESDDLFASLDDVPHFEPDLSKGVPGYTGWMLNRKPFRYVSRDDRDALPDEVSAAYAADLIRRGFSQPFCLCVGFMRPHAPLIVPQEYFDLFPLEEVEVTSMKEGDLEDCARILWESTPDLATYSHGRDRYRRLMEGGGVELLRRWTQAYLASIAFADAQLGKVLDALEASPYADDTLVVVTSDNGYHMGEKEQLFKNTPWEEANRVPLIVSGPGVAQDAECATPVSLIDLYPTFCDYGSLDAQPHAHHALDGHSLRPFLEAPSGGCWDGPDYALSVLASGKPVPTQTPADPAGQHYSLRSARYRYILCNSDEEELYDHEEDPWEWHNRANDPALHEIKADLRSKLIKLTGCR